MANFLKNYGDGRYTITVRFKGGKTTVYRGRASDESERMREILKRRKHRGDIEGFTIKREK